MVQYEVGIHGSTHHAVAMIAARPYLVRRAVKPESVALAQRAAERSPARMPLYYDAELDALILWYPLDIELPALAEPVTRLVEELEAAGVSLGDARDSVTLGYMPRRRAVLRVGGHVLKLYSHETHFAAAIANLLTAGGLPGIRTPSFEGSLQRSLVTAQTFLPGSPPERPAAVARSAGELLRAVAVVDPPKAGLLVAPPTRQLAIVGACARYLAAILPPLARRLEALVRELEATAPSIDRLVLAHGDFSARQLIVSPDGLGVVDWDAMHIAPAALDPATYAAHLVFGGPHDLDTASAALEELLAGYGDRPAGLSWYLSSSILRHARAPFRYLDEHWPERVERMVAAAETALEE